MAILINDEFGGKIAKTKVNHRTYYFNIINDTIIDLTAEQFNSGINYEAYSICDKKKMLLGNDTKKRYLLLKQRYNDLKI